MIMIVNVHKVFLLHAADADCPDPGQVDNAVRNGKTAPYPIGTVMVYTCNTGYSGGGNITCQSNARWTSSPICHGMNFNFSCHHF